MSSIRSHKIRLDPNEEQEVFFRKCVGTSRFAYNLALSQWQEQHKAGMKPNESRLRRELNAVKRESYPWMLETPKSVVQQAIKNVGVAYANFFRRCRAKVKRKGFPKFKSKHSSRQSARLDNGPGTFSFDGKRVKLPKIGVVKTFECIRWSECRPLSAVLRREGERWFLSVAVEIDAPQVGENQTKPAIGIDLGLTSAVALSNGEKFCAPKPLKSCLKKLARLQRSVSRKVKGSKNRTKAKRLVARLHWRIAQIRKDWQHKITAMIARRFSLVAVEDLNVRGMMANSRLSRSISDVGWYELRRQLEYKSSVVAVDRWFPTSKTCSSCGEVAASMPLNIRDWTCDGCGSRHDRDINAAVNICNEGIRIHAASCAVKACGEDGSGDGFWTSVKPSSVKQESMKSHLILN